MGRTHDRYDSDVPACFRSNIQSVRGLSKRSSGRASLLLTGAMGALLTVGCSAPVPPTTTASSTTGVIADTSAPSASIASTLSSTSTISDSSMPATEGFAIDSDGKFRTPKGYEYDLQFNWAAHLAEIDVADNPPGKADVTIFRDRAFRGTFTNVTEGGRDMPGVQSQLVLLGIYPADASVCAVDAPWPSTLTNALNPWNQVTGPGICAIPLEIALQLTDPSGPFGTGKTLANNVPIEYSSNDLINSIVQGSKGVRWSGVDEDAAAEMVAELNHPVGFGLSFTQSERDGRVISENGCDFTYRSLGSEAILSVAIVDSNFGTSIPECTRSTTG